jgi:hypothetical protein
MTVPVETPGDLAALRFCTQFRARGVKDLVRAVVSFDGGKTWQEAARMAGPTQGRTEVFRFARIPKATRKALLRYELSGNNTVGILSFRVDADYRDPLAAPAFRPFDIVHRWKENGKVKEHREHIPRLPYTYPIKTVDVPEMVSVTYEMAAK